MSTVNKQSVREEAERLKLEFDRLVLNKKINSDAKVLVQGMLLLINLLISVFFRKNY